MIRLRFQRWAILTAVSLCVGLAVEAQAQDAMDVPPPVVAEPDPFADSQASEGEEDPFATPPEQPLPGPSALPGLNMQLQNPFNSPFSQQNFVPDISLILDLALLARDKDNESYRALPQALSLTSHGGHAHAGINSTNAYNLNYAELTMAAPVDPFVELFTTFHLTAGGFEIEEAYALTRGLPFNFQLKAGKFLSGFGRLNGQHAHYWSFAEMPTVYAGMFGDHGLNELGAQLSWVAPLDTYVQLGAEVLRGSNEGSFGTAGFTRGSNRLTEVNLPSLVTGFARTSLEWDNLIFLGGVSYAQGGTRIAGEEAASGDLHVHQAATAADVSYFAGGSRILGAELTARYLIDSYRDITWQSEYLHRWTDGSVYTPTGRDAFSASQGGLYSQLLWRFAWQWRTGLRVDLITQDQRSQAGALNSQGLQPRFSGMLEFNPTEFSRLRLQANHDRTRGEAINEIFLQLNFSMGAHGAHQF